MINEFIIVNRLRIRSGSSIYYKPSCNWVYSVAVCSKTDEVISKKRNYVKQKSEMWNKKRKTHLGSSNEKARKPRGSSFTWREGNSPSGAINNALLLTFSFFFLSPLLVIASMWTVAKSTPLLIKFAL